MTAQTHWINTPQGRLFASAWQPETTNRDHPPIVLLHDSLGCVTLWRHFPARLAEATGRKVIAYDRLGFGQSDPYPGDLPYSFIEDEARDGFAAVREHFGLDRYALLGHSVGGGMAVTIAGHAPDRCEAVITVAAQASVEAKTREGIRRAQRIFADPGQRERLAKYHGAKSDWALRMWFDIWLSPAFDHWTLDEALAKVTAPTLAIHGADDDYGLSDQPARIAAHVAGPSRYELIPDCGHIPHRQCPDVLVSHVAAFLADGG